MERSGDTGSVQTTHERSNLIEEEKKDEILRELDSILESPFFRKAGRSRQFLAYVVKHRLDGPKKSLKERMIGVEVFGRSADYATGDDPVVRVQAGEVRRRLEQYYQTTASGAPIQIVLPIGSYSPLFRDVAASGADAANAAGVMPIGGLGSKQPPAAAAPARRRDNRPWIIAAACALVGIGALINTLFPRSLPPEKRSAIEQFWSPVFATPQPVLICLASPVVYRPTDALYKRYIRTHPGTFQTEVERANTLLPLDPREPIVWGDMWNYSDYGVARGDTYTAVTISGLLGRFGKPSQVRIGATYSFSDLRNSPAVVVGAFNNRWTMQLTSNLRFVFTSLADGRNVLKEQLPRGRIWEKHLGKNEEVLDDAAIVSRLLDSKTGQFTNAVAGIGGTGTQAAGEFVSTPAFFEQGLKSFPPGWQTKNLELVLQTTVTDMIPGPPRVVAVSSW